MDTDKEYSSESAKLAYDLYKQLITIDTGSIVLLVTLLDKLFQHPEWRGAMVLSLVGFTVSVAGCTGMLVIVVADVAHRGDFGNTGVSNLAGATATIVAWAGFLTGLVSLVVFTLKNLY
jgi:hypothetical protein